MLTLARYTDAILRIQLADEQDGSKGGRRASSPRRLLSQSTPAVSTNSSTASLSHFVRAQQRIITSSINLSALLRANIRVILLQSNVRSTLRASLTLGFAQTAKLGRR